MKKIIPWLLLLLFLIPLKTQAVSIALACYNTGSCTLCDALELGQKILRAILGLSGSLALLFFVWAGFKMIISQGNSGKVAEAQKMMTTAIVGIFIVLLAWTMVNFIIWALVGQNTSKGVSTIFSSPWQTIKCEGPTSSGNSNINTGTTNNNSGVCVSTWKGEKGNSCNGSCDNFITSGASMNGNQCADASPSLTNFLTALTKELAKKNTDGTFFYDPLTKEEIIITSISDDHGLGYCRDTYPQQCGHYITTNCCYHAKNSCHYGHGETNGSYAFDVSFSKIPLGSREKAQLETIVEQKLKGKFEIETDHYHISTSACAGT